MIELLKRLFQGRELPPENLGRNDRCWCGSGKKYKRCCFDRDQDVLASQRAKNCGPRS
jgi:hypothetical protein